MAPAVRILALLLLVAAAATPPRAHAEDSAAAPPALAAFQPRTVDLPRGVGLEVLALTVPPGIRVVDVVAVADVDVDLYVHAALLGVGELDEADHVADSWDGFEHLAWSTGPEGATWYVHVVNPSSAERSARVGVVAGFAQDDARLLLPGQRVPCTLPPGADACRFDLLLPPGLAWAAVEAEAARGVPGLEVRRGAALYPALHRGLGAVVWLPGAPEVPGGRWQVVLSRPAGASASVPFTAAVEASCGAPLPDEGRVLSHEPLALRGPSGRHVVEIEPDASFDGYLDVPPSARSLELSTELEEGDVDLYLARHRPASTETPAYWGWSSWRDGRRETLVAGDRAPLPVGRYWVRVEHANGDGGTVTLRWTLRTGLARARDRVVERGTLGEGALWDVAIEAEVPVAWWRLAPSIGPGAHLQILGADKDVDLLVARADTGQVVALSLTTRNDEYLRIPPDLVVPEAAGLRLGVGRWQVSREVTAGELHVRTDERPLPPERYFPPYHAWDAVPASGPMAAAVEVRTSGGTGSGIVVSPTGLLLTCQHVIEDLGAGETARIAFPTGPRGRPRQVYEARVAAADEALDLALLEIVSDVFGRARNGSRALPFVAIGDSRRLPPGSPLRVAGYGYAGSSGFASNLLVLSGTLAGVETEGTREVWLITDARLGAGNSGAGYFDLEDRLVGIHSRGYGHTGSDLGYGRPSSRIPEPWRARIRAEGGDVAASE